MKLIIAAIMIALFIAGCASQPPTSKSQDIKYRCQTESDCSSTCGMKCVNSQWAQSYKDTCMNIRAYKCTCEYGMCYSDGKPPVK